MKKFFLVICVLAFAFQVWATDYYFSQSGDDTTGDGSVGTPYKTISKASTTLSTGDTGYFNRGDVWSEAWASPVAAPSEESERITYSSYGTGDRPTFRQPAAQNTTTVIVNDKSYLSFVGIAFDGNGANQASGSARAFDVTGNSGNLIWTNCEFYGATKDSVSAHGLLINSTGSTFMIDECIYHNNISYGVLTLSAGTTIQNSTFYDLGKPIGLTTSGSFTASGNTITRWAWGTQPDGAIVVNTPGDDILITGNNVSDPQAEYDCYRINLAGGAQTNVQITDNYGDGGGSSDYGLFVDATGMSGLVVDNNIITGFLNSGICVFSADSFSISNNKVTGSGLGAPGTHDAGINIYGSAAEGNAVDGVVANNILDGNQIGIQIWGDDADGNADGIDLINNTINGSVAQNIYFRDYGQNSTLVNNISYSPGTLHVDVETNASIASALNNSYYPEGDDVWEWQGTTDIDTLAAWKTTSSLAETGSLNSDPLLNLDYSLTPSSPAIKAGTRADAVSFTNTQTDGFGNEYFFAPYDLLNIGADQNYSDAAVREISAGVLWWNVILGDDGSVTYLTDVNDSIILDVNDNPIEVD